MLRNRWHVVAPVLIFGMTGCSVLEYSSSKPIIQRQADSISGADVFAVDATRRVVLSQTGDSKRQFCSEPPPDVAQSFADSVRAALQMAAQQQSSFNQSNQRTLNVTPPAGATNSPATDQSGSQQVGGGQSASANGSLNLARDFATSISQIYTRSQGVQLFRDGAFMLCQAHLNQALRGDSLEEKKRLAQARFQFAQQLQLFEMNPTGGAVDQSKAAQATPSQENLDRAAKALPDPTESAELNYSTKFTQLLNTAHSILLVEMPLLYRYDAEQSKAAAEAAARAITAKTQANASAAAANASETNASQMRDQAAQSAIKAAEANASATTASISAKASAEAAAAAAKAASGK